MLNTQFKNKDIQLLHHLLENGHGTFTNTNVEETELVLARIFFIHFATQIKTSGLSNSEKFLTQFRITLNFALARHNQITRSKVTCAVTLTIIDILTVMLTDPPPSEEMMRFANEVIQKLQDEHSLSWARNKS